MCDHLLLAFVLQDLGFIPVSLPPTQEIPGGHVFFTDKLLENSSKFAREKKPRQGVIVYSIDLAFPSSQPPQKFEGVAKVPASEYAKIEVSLCCLPMSGHMSPHQSKTVLAWMWCAGSNPKTIEVLVKNCERPKLTCHSGLCC